MTADPTDMQGIADGLQTALTDFDLERIEALLDPQVTWGDCGSSADVIDLVASMQADGVRPIGASTLIDGDKIVMSVDVEVGGEPATIHQAVFVESGKVIEVIHCQTKDEAISAQRSAAFTAPDTPTPFESVAPVLPVSDMATAIAHYRGLGFEVESYDGGNFYAFGRRGQVQIHLCRVADLDPKTTTTSIYLYVGNARDLFAEWRDAGLDGRFGAPVDTDYGLIEAFHIDPWGNLLRYGSPVD